MGIHQEHRHYQRFAPPACELRLVPAHLMLMLRGTQAGRVFDLSEGGFRAAVSPRPGIGDRFRARLGVGRYGEKFDVQVQVCDTEICRLNHGEHVAGFQFLKPSPVLRVCLQSMLFEWLRDHAKAHAEVPELELVSGSPDPH